MKRETYGLQEITGALRLEPASWRGANGVVLIAQGHEGFLLTKQGRYVGRVVVETNYVPPVDERERRAQALGYSEWDKRRVASWRGRNTRSWGCRPRFKGFRVAAVAVRVKQHAVFLDRRALAVPGALDLAGKRFATREAALRSIEALPLRGC